jgi:hypothetical protein
MKNKNNNVPATSKVNLLRQICNFIPEFLVSKIARDTKVDVKARTFTPWSHVVTLLYAQLTHRIGLNDVCDALRLHSGPLSSIREATPPSRNNLSHADKVRPAEMAEKLFWAVFEHLGDLSPRFVGGKSGKRFARKFKRTIHLVDSTTIPLIASCLDWAKHRRRKAAAKCHLRLDLQSFLPRFAIVDTARHHDAQRARELCAGIASGEIVIFDKAYIDFGHLADLSIREVFWVTRAKDNMQYEVEKYYQTEAQGKILSDELIRLKSPHSLRLSGVAAPGGGAGGGGWQGSGDGVFDQQPGLERGEHRGVVSLPLADRSVFQADQADLATGRFPGHQRQCGALAGMDGALGLSAVALRGVPIGLEP